MSYQLRQTQLIRADLPTVFGFFKDPRNLEALTPPWLGFRVLDASSRVVAEGTRIRYRLRLHGIPLRWESRITEYEENARFADVMVTGPYRAWYHRHLFRAVPEGVEMEDVVDYALPFGPLGRLAHAVAVRRQLAAIFAYRRQRVDELFPSKEVTA